MDDSTALTPEETQALARYETVIERGLATFIAVGNALMTIRDRRLYRTEYRTFEEYCRDRWGISRPRAYQMVEASSVVENLSTMVDIPLPINERQARPLAPLSPDQQREAWTRVVETAPNGKVTGAHVQAVADQVLFCTPKQVSASTNGQEKQTSSSH